MDYKAKAHNTMLCGICGSENTGERLSTEEFCLQMDGERLSCLFVRPF
jgi:hypothetical protein